MLNDAQGILNYGKGVFMETEKVLPTLRSALGLQPDSTDFDTEIRMHMNAALATLRQNGVTIPGVTITENTTWSELKDPAKIKGNDYFDMVPTYVFASTKILFDPPPPSNVPYYDNKNNELLWRLRTAYEEDNYVAPTGSITPVYNPFE